VLDKDVHTPGVTPIEVKCIQRHTPEMKGVYTASHYHGKPGCRQASTDITPAALPSNSIRSRL